MSWIWPLMLFGGAKVAQQAEAAVLLKEYERQTQENSKKLSRICLDNLAESQRLKDKEKGSGL